MNWLQISIETTTEGINKVCSALSEIGIEGFEIDDGKVPFCLAS